MSRWRKLFGRIDPEDIADDPDADMEAVFGKPDPRSPASAETLFQLLAHLGAPLTDGIDTFMLEREDLGEVRSLTGEFVICDPLVSNEGAPLIAARSGAVSVVRRKGDVASRVGMAMLVFANAEPVTWRPLGEYGVDTGTSCFADPAALEALRRRSAAYYAQDGELSGEEPLVDAITAHDALLYDVDADHRIAAFQTGVGDGVYGAWVGLDADGVPCVAVTSFNTIAEESVVSR